MSAYLVEKKHIMYLVAAGKYFGRDFKWYHGGNWHGFGIGIDRVAEVANMLWQENGKAIQARYGDDGVEGLEKITATYCSGKTLTTINLTDLSKAVNCYVYQSCDPDDWESTEAYAYCQALKDEILRRLPGYEQAQWGAPDNIFQTQVYCLTDMITARGKR